MSLLGLFEQIPGQDRLARELEAHLDRPRNSYFFLGAYDAGVLAAAKSFAKSLLCEEGGCGKCLSCQSVERGTHPDVAIFERSGAALTVEEAQEIVRLSMRSTSGSKYRVIIVPELELVGRAAPVLLKSVEEPPPSTIFLLLASMEVPELKTLMSRSVVLTFDQLSDEKVYSHLLNMGFGAQECKLAVRLSAGRWSRAIELAQDPELREAVSLWEKVPALLKKDMAQVVALVDQLLEVGSMVEERRRAEQKNEIEELNKTAKAMGVSRSTLSDSVEERHRRELRRIRTAELRSGLMLLERHYRDLLLQEDGLKAEWVSAIRLIEDAQMALTRNCNEFLMLMALLSRLATKSS